MVDKAKIGKEEFYPLIKRFLESEGFKYYAEDELKGIGRGNRKPDFVAIKDSWFLVGEIKSPSEPATSPSWRSEQSYDSENMRSVRRRVRDMEKAGKVSTDIGGHAIIMLGQIPEYIRLIGKRWVPPEPVECKKILGAYAFPATWKEQVEEAVRIFDIPVLQRLTNHEVQVWVLDKNL